MPPGGADIPVYPGAAAPMVKNLSAVRAALVPEPVLSGTAQIDGVTVSMNPDVLPLPDSPSAPQEMPAALYYLEFLRSTPEKITIVATGALTNLGLALTLDPRIADSIEELVIMGGGVNKSNITASAEANFYKDPEAAAIVLGCGAPITLCTLDATHSCALTEAHERRLRAVGNTAAIFTANDVRARRESYARFQPLERPDTAPIHDALCIAYLLDPGVLLRVEEAACEVDCSDGTARAGCRWTPLFSRAAECPLGHTGGPRTGCVRSCWRPFPEKGGEPDEHKKETHCFGDGRGQRRGCRPPCWQRRPGDWGWRG